MAEEIKYRKLEGSTDYGIFNRNYMIRKTTEADLRHTLALCEDGLASGHLSGDMVKSYEKLRASILEGLNG